MKAKDLLKQMSADIHAPEEVSLEDYLHAYDNVVEIQQDIDNKTQDIRRSSEIAESLEDLLVVADNISSATPNEANLIEIGGNIAVAGTNANASDIIPSMESYIGGKISLESLTDIKAKIKKIWEHIKKTTKEILNRIKEYINQSSIMIAYVLNQVIKLEKQVDKVKDKEPKKDLFALDTEEYDVIFNNGRFADNDAYFISNQLQKTTEFFNTGADKYCRELAELFTDLKKKIDAITKVDQLVSAHKDIFVTIAKENAEIFNNLAVSGSNGAMVGVTKDNGLDKVYVRTTLMGGLSFEFNAPDLKGIGDDSSVLVERLRASSIKVVPGLTGKAFPVITNSKPLVSPYTYKELGKINKEARLLLESVKRFRDRGNEIKLTDAKKALDVSIDKLVSRLDVSEDSDATLLDQIMSISSMVNSWVNQPIRGIITHILKVERGIIWLLKQNIGHYVGVSDKEE